MGDFAEVFVDAEEEIVASLPDLAPPSVDAASSMEALPVEAGAVASLNIAPVVADVSASLEEMSDALEVVPVAAEVHASIRGTPAVAGEYDTSNVLQEEIDSSTHKVVSIEDTTELSSREISGGLEGKSDVADPLPDREESVVADNSVSLGTETSAKLKDTGTRPKQSNNGPSSSTKNFSKGPTKNQSSDNSERKIIRLQHRPKEKATNNTSPVEGSSHKAGKGKKK